MTDYAADNRANWDDRVPIHWGSAEYDPEGFIANPELLSEVVAYDAAHLDVAGRTLVHLQCHFGRDTLSWARLGADVTGVDFSEPAIAAARRLSERSGTPGRFVVADVYDAPAVLGREYDVVYTGVGAINWLPDIRRWAEVVAALLAPGGTFYIREGHPELWSLDWERDDEALVVRAPYFETEEPLSNEWDETYAGGGKVANARSHEWNHGIGEIFTALTDAGLRVTRLTEHREVEWQALPVLQPSAGHGRWMLPEHLRDRVPLMFTMIAEKPA